MAFKVPSLPKLWKRKTPEERFLKQCKDLPVTEFKFVEVLTTIASGSFGLVKLCKKNGTKFVLKEIIDEDHEQERLFIKEASLLHNLHHENIVKFDSVVYCGNRKFGFLMEYMQFDFIPFGGENKISSLKDFLYNLDNDCNFSGFEHLQICIAQDICRGLTFLHENDVVHRDLKPDNVLISNQHYTKDNIGAFWETKPVVAKLADFGESRSKLIRTSSLLHTKTENINRGTPIFMAPELYRNDSLPMTLEKLKSTDVWSMSMIFYMLINPDRRYPYEADIKGLKKSGMTRENIMKRVFEKLTVPEHSEKYSVIRDGQWSQIKKAFIFAAKFENRPTALQVRSLLEKKFDKKTSDRNLFSDFDACIRTSPEKKSTQSACEDKLKTSLCGVGSQRKPSDMKESRTDVVEELSSGEKSKLQVVHSHSTRPMDESNKNQNLDMSSAAKRRRKNDHEQLSIKSTKENNAGIGKFSSFNPTPMHDEASQESGLMKHSMEMDDLPSIKMPNEQTREKDNSEDTILYTVDTRKIQDNSPDSEMFENHNESEKQTRTIDDRAEITQSKIGNIDAVIGHFHQSTPEIFKHAAAGTQCSSICLTAIVAAQLKAIEDWNADFIDKILQKGDRLHLRILKRYNWPFGRSESKLDMDEMPDMISLEIDGCEAEASIGVLSDASFGFSNEIHSLIMNALKNKPNKSFILRCFGLCTAIICGQYQRYSIFDPHSRNQEGEIDAEGSAGLFHFTNVSDMMSYLQNQCGNKQEQVDLYPIDVEILETRQIDEDVYEPALLHSNRKDSSLSNSATPVYSNKDKGLTLEEIIGICTDRTTFERSKICKTVPRPKSDSVFVVDMTAVEEKDLTCDDSGTYDSHSSPSSLVEVAMTSNGKKIKNLKIISRSKISEADPRLKQDNTFLVKRLYSVQNNKCGKSLRIISKVFNKSELCKYALIQYIGERQSMLRPHGNSKKRETLYMRTKPSVISKEKEFAREMAPKQVINLIDKETKQNNDSPSDFPRDRQQVYNLKKRSNITFKARNTGRVAAPDFSKLVASMDNDGFVKNVDFASRERCKRIHPNTFAATNNMLIWTKTFCNPHAQHKSQVGIDMTYKVGPFYTTCLSFPHPMFVHKGDQQKHPTVFTGMSTSTGRQKEDYMYLAGQLKANGIEKLIYGTDGELALELGMEAVYPIEGVSQSNRNIKLRCFNHVKDDLVMELKKYPSLEKESVIKSIIGKEFNGRRDSGLVDSNNFEEDYRFLSAQWPTNFKEYLESTQLKVRSLKETLKKCMGRETRIAAGLGNPPNKYDNQRAESMNNVLKESLGSKFVDQASVHDLVYENIVIPQERELIKAIYGHGEYRLATTFKHLEIHPLKWASMTEQQKQHHINRVFHCKVHLDNEKPILRKLSVQPEDCQSFLSALPQALVRDLWKAAELILSYNKVDEMENGNFCVAEDEQAFILKETPKGLSCQCTQFKKLGLCGHVIVVADDRGRLDDILKNFKYNPSIAIYKNKPSSSGEKRVKKPRKGLQNIKKMPILVEEEEESDAILELNAQRPFQFCEPWHNDEAFKIVRVDSVKGKRAVSCTSCTSLISTKNSLPPFDIMFSHLERYKYPQQAEDGKLVWRTTKKKMRPHYYCIKKKCVLRRHPYFWLGLIDISEVALQDIHMNMLRDVLGFEI